MFGSGFGSNLFVAIAVPVIGPAIAISNVVGNSLSSSSGPRSENKNGAMADVGVSQSVLVEPRGDSGRKLPQYIAALSATLGALAAGSMLGWSSPVMYQAINGHSTYDFRIEEQESWISSLVNLGAAAICFPIGLIMDTIGRKKTMLFLVIPFTLGWLLITFAQNVAMIMIGRFITGVAGGAFCVTAPAYTSEIAQDSIRGALGTYFQLMITVGILFSYVVGSYASIFVFNLLCTCIPIVFGVIFFFMPESPSFLVMKARNDEARESLIKLRGRGYDVDGELDSLKLKDEQKRTNNVSFLRSITKKTALKAVLICYALMLFQQLSGINAVLFNTSTIFGSAGAAINPEVATIIIGVIQVVATLISSMVVDRLGRRILLLFSALVMCLCLTALGVFFFLRETHGEHAEILKSISWLPLLSLSLFITAFSFGFGPIPWMMAGELCLIDIKAFVSSTAGTFNWLLSFAVTSTFVPLKTSIGDGQVFWMFAGIMLLGFIFIFFVVPETKGKSVDEIQVMLGGSPQTQKNNDTEKK
ncbi:sugar transporter domain-containing protein [Phthorimaea operculella]|nr:sugar transporter domain-containing protein [Phthorimaea operculella]